MCWNGKRSINGARPPTGGYRSVGVSFRLNRLLAVLPDLDHREIELVGLPSAAQAQELRRPRAIGFLSLGRRSGDLLPESFFASVTEQNRELSRLLGS
jgi:hypothetical protein